MRSHPERSVPTSSVAEIAALARVFEEYRPRLLAMIRRRIDPALAARIDPEDILHESFIRAMGKSSGRDTSLPAYGWLYGITRDCVIDAWRAANAVGRSIQREVPWPEQTSIQLGLGLVASMGSPSAAIRRGERNERIRSAVGRLKPEDQEVLWMRHGDDLSFAEVATVLGVSENTATQRYVRALRRFRKLWSEVEPPSNG